MKKISIFGLGIFLICVNLGTTCFADNVFENQQIDIMLKECCTENYMTEQMNKCTYQAIDAWTQEITKYDRLIVAQLDPINTNSEKLKKCGKNIISRRKHSYIALSIKKAVIYIQLLP